MMENLFATDNTLSSDENVKHRNVYSHGKTFRNSEANASEFLRNLGEVFARYL